MKRNLLFLLFLPFFVQCIAAEEVQKTCGIDIFIEACRHSGNNTALIRSMYVEAEVTYPAREFSEADKARRKAEWEEIREALERFAKERAKDDPEVLAKEMEMIEREEAHFLSQTGQPERRAKVEQLSEGPNDVLRRVWTRRYEWQPETNAWELGLEYVQGPSDIPWDTEPKGNKTFQISHERRHGGEIKIADLRHGSWSTTFFHRFGRIQGLSEMGAFFALFVEQPIMPGHASKEPTDFTLREDRVAAYKKMLADAAQEHNISFFNIVGEVEYAPNAKAIVLETTVNGEVAERFWIDPARGFITPLIQTFMPDTGKLVIEFKASDYFQAANSQLWYPATYIEKRYDHTDGSLREHVEYRINPATFWINREVADADFAIEIPQRALIDNQRDGKHYRALRAGKLSLADGYSDFATIDWLHEGREMPHVPADQEEHPELRQFRAAEIEAIRLERETIEKKIVREPFDESEYPARVLEMVNRVKELFEESGGVLLIGRVRYSDGSPVGRDDLTFSLRAAPPWGEIPGRCVHIGDGWFFANYLYHDPGSKQMLEEAEAQGRPRGLMLSVSSMDCLPAPPAVFRIKQGQIIYLEFELERVPPEERFTKGDTYAE